EPPRPSQVFRPAAHPRPRRTGSGSTLRQERHTNWRVVAVLRPGRRQGLAGRLGKLERFSAHPRRPCLRLVARRWPGRRARPRPLVAGRRPPARVCARPRISRGQAPPTATHL
ncbi:MAG: hypothetical protein AVDCRST_MAG77-4671, partial [uncultured Chloroflexi bacterium]